MKMQTTLPSIALAAILGSAASAPLRAHDVGLKEVASGFVSPVAMASIPGSAKTVLVVDQVGKILRVDTATGASEVALDLTPKLSKMNKDAFDERGALGIALHPGFAINLKLYVAFTAPLGEGAPNDYDHTLHVSQFTAKSGENLTIDPASEKVVLKSHHPYFNHNGGAIAFGPDGMLYIAMGDGGNGNDEGKRPASGNGQNLDTLMGKILRIDVDKGDPYSIPTDNPFASNGKGRPEIYAYGLRNPWRVSFDRGGSRQLFAADVGQDSWEEVNIITKGGNYGWKIREGDYCFDPKREKTGIDDCPKVGASGEPLIGPAIAYRNFKAFPKAPDAKGISITGGYVYRGKSIPSLEGRYVFADWSQAWVLPKGVLFAASKDGSGSWSMEDLGLKSHPKGLNAYVTAFGEDEAGELYVLTNGSNALRGNTGKLFKLIPM